MARWFLLALLAALAPVSWLLAAPPEQKTATRADGKGPDFFEQKIRPVLVEHCYKCHSAEAVGNKRLKGGLFVDSIGGLLKGGDTGPAVIPGKAEQSLLIKALHYSDDLQMPPQCKLPDLVISDFVAWVNMGAPGPRASEPGKGKTITVEEGGKFWAYQAPRKAQPPEVKDASWPSNDLDRFILALLEARGLRPAADADRATLARRLYYDLIGLPPSPEQVDAFVNDPSPEAYERLVEQLLASPHFGEHWGRHWLDVARFGESHGFEQDYDRPSAYQYRDAVIQAFNQDMPFDRFIEEQVAGDLLPAATVADRRRQLTATTFLTLGNVNLEEQDKKQLRMDVVDEQLEAIGRGFLAQTIGCARCHDHKFDPIPTRDYYALAGILRNTKTVEHANVSRLLERPLPAEPVQEAELQKYESAVAALEARIQALAGQTASGKGRTSSGRTKVVAVEDLAGVVVDDTQAKKVGEWKVSRALGPYVGSGYVHDMGTGKGEKTLTFQPELPTAGKYEVRLAYTAWSDRASAVPVTVFSADGDKTVVVNQQQPPPLDGLFVSLGQHHFEANNQGYVLISNEGTQGVVVADAVVFIPVEKLERAGSLAAPPPDPQGKPAADQSNVLKKLEAELKRMRLNGPKRAMVMAVQEEPEISDAQVHIRGSVHNLGERAPRGFLQVATRGPLPAMPTNESGRRQLAKWLASRDNPLTARVLVNRAWHWLFGAGIVRTTDNFGTTGELPSHPELLDYLAVRFVEDGWSMKQLIRQMVLSRTYRLSTASPAQALAADPENRLLCRMNRRRLDAECIRDTMLSVSGQLRLEMGGRTFRPDLKADYGYQQAEDRRSVYLPVFRNALPQLLEVFDFADPSVCTGRRHVSTVATQALFLMNHPFVLEQARQAAQRLLADKDLDDQGRVTRAYRLTLGRPPSPGERRIAAKFLRSDATAPQEAWASFYQALFASMDFRYVD